LFCFYLYRLNLNSGLYIQTFKIAATWSEYANKQKDPSS